MATKVAMTYNRTGISSYFEEGSYLKRLLGHISVTKIRVHSLIDAEPKANHLPPNRHVTCRWVLLIDNVPHGIAYLCLRTPELGT